MKKIYEIVWEAEKVTPKPTTYGHDSVTVPISPQEKLVELGINIGNREFKSLVNSKLSRELKVEGLLLKKLKQEKNGN